MLSDFRIQRFRAFADLDIATLGRVNLIVGKNAVGKSTVLEALHVLATGASELTLTRILADRDDLPIKIQGENGYEYDYEFASLFHGRELGFASEDAIVFGCRAVPELLRIQATYLTRVPVKENGVVVGSKREPISRSDAIGDPNADITLQVKEFGFGPHYLYTRRDGARRIRVPSERPAMVSAAGASPDVVARWWDAITLRDAEDRVAACLREIMPVERVSYIERPDSRGRKHERMAMVRLEGQSDPVPLKSLGDGLSQMFQIALAFEFVGSKRTYQRSLLNGAEQSDLPRFVLIDEVEKGVHYSAHSRLWAWIFRLAKLHDVQVFATTHSWDCIEGFQIAANDDAECQGVLVRIEVHKAGHRAVTFAENELAIVARDSIEVR